MYSLFIRANRRVQEPEGLELIWTQKNLQPWLWNNHAIIRTSWGLKVGIHRVFLRLIWQERKNPFSSYIIYFDLTTLQFLWVELIR